MGKKFVPVTNTDGSSTSFLFDCPGCGKSHQVYTTPSPDNGCVWQFNGDVEKPTITPSLKVQYVKCDYKDGWPIPETRKEMVCHSFIKDGMIQFLDDCTHKHAGKTVEIPDFSLDNI